jgi:hypothetical protein
MAAAQGLEMHGMRDQKKEKAEEDGEVRAMPLVDGQGDQGKRAEEQGAFRQELFVDFRGAVAL